MATRANSEHILGQYRLLERLGKGGMRVVYRARDPGARRQILGTDIKLTSAVRDGQQGRKPRVVDPHP
jgi:hypothetical protein